MGGCKGGRVVQERWKTGWRRCTGVDTEEMEDRVEEMAAVSRYRGLHPPKTTTTKKKQQQKTNNNKNNNRITMSFCTF